MISHKNVIANVLQMRTFEDPWRKTMIEPGNQSDYTENVLGLVRSAVNALARSNADRKQLPLNHIYALIVIAHLGAYRGDGIIILPKFEFKSFLETIQAHKIGCLYLVPPIIITLTKSRDVVKQYDLSSVRSIFTGAAPLGEETAEDLQSMFPKWAIRQGYGSKLLYLNPWTFGRR
jgi:acyl-CoA synthetase (AMP-forming)/AMP-acid ligase II